MNMSKQKLTSPAYVGFGMLTPVIIMTVDQFPRHNTGARVNQVKEFVFDDAAIVACCLRQWGVETGIIGTAVGNDPRGHALAHQLEEWGVQGEVRFTDAYPTPLEVDVSDRKGARTFFWQRNEEILATLDSADLSLIKDARLLYVDWYDGEEHITRAMKEADRLGVPVFLNLEHGHKNLKLLKRYAELTFICQAVTDAAQLGKNRALLHTARKLIDAGVEMAVITMAAEGCLVAEGKNAVRVFAPEVKAIDAAGAGAAFSSGFAYGYLQGWSIEKTARFATAAASLKVTRAGLEMFPQAEIEALAATLEVEYLTYRDNQFHKISKVIAFQQKSLERKTRNLARRVTGSQLLSKPDRSGEKDQL
ncbi:MAG: carbohydrate kinase family protein [Anaerolineae bacterium]|nr:carbohydrate kinase family protein [Anaerolineae bacterium]